MTRGILRRWIDRLVDLNGAAVTVAIVVAVLLGLAIAVGLAP